MATEGKDPKGDYIVGGYEFVSEQDAQKAAMDQNKIRLLEARVKASRPNDIKAVYEKAIENKIFKTPIGWNYLIAMREKLIRSGFTQEDLIPIPLNISMNRHSAIENLAVKQRIKVEKPKRNLEFGRIFSIILNVALVILVVIMFIITEKSDSDNILNYKRNVTDRYSAWEQELTERERAVRQAEKKLGIESSSNYDEDISN